MPYNPETIRVALSTDGKSLVAITEHGHEISLTLDAAGILRLHSMLTTKHANSVKPLILADYKRLGPHGAGKILKFPSKAPKPKSAHAVRLMTPPPSPANPPTPTQKLRI